MGPPEPTQAEKERHRVAGRHRVPAPRGASVVRHQEAGRKEQEWPREAKEGKGTLPHPYPIVDPLSPCQIDAAPPMLKSHQPHRMKT